MQLRLSYFKFPFWRAEVSRLALFLGDVPFENHHPSRDEFQKMKAEGELPFGQLPILLVNGEAIAQTGAIARFCGKLSGLYPEDNALDAARVDQLIDAATDITNRVGLTMRIKDSDERLEARRVLARETLPLWLGYLESLLATSDSGFFVGENMTIADLAIWRLSAWLRGGILDGIPREILTPFPLLKAHCDRTEDTPRIREWMTEQYSERSAQ